MAQGNSSLSHSWLHRGRGLQIQALLDGFNLCLGLLRAGFVIGSALELGVLDLGIELDLRLGARGTY